MLINLILITVVIFLITVDVSVKCFWVKKNTEWNIFLSELVRLRVKIYYFQIQLHRDLLCVSLSVLKCIIKTYKESKIL